MSTKSPWIALLWIVAWLPLSFFFPSHPHFPSGLFAPIMGFFTLMSLPPSGSNEWQEVFFPFLVFWIGLAAAFVVPYIFKKLRAR